MREICTYGSEGGEAEINRPSLPLSLMRLAKSVLFGRCLSQLTENFVVPRSQKPVIL
jgi:hypothetical protein